MIIRTEADSDIYGMRWCGYCHSWIREDDLPFIAIEGGVKDDLLLHKNCAVAMAAKIQNEFEKI